MNTRQSELFATLSTIQKWGWGGIRLLIGERLQKGCERWQDVEAGADKMTPSKPWALTGVIIRRSPSSWGWSRDDTGSVGVLRRPQKWVHCLTIIKIGIKLFQVKLILIMALLVLFQLRTNTLLKAESPQNFSCANKIRPEFFFEIMLVDNEKQTCFY